jgi:hypothetical protein
LSTDHLRFKNKGHAYMKTKPCNRCNIGRAKLDERFCPRCREIVQKEMATSGYLTDANAIRRPSEQRARSQRYGNSVGGSAEMGSDGDEP